MKEKNMAQQITNPAEWSVRFLAVVGNAIIPRIASFDELHKLWRRDYGISSTQLIHSVMISNESTGIAHPLETDGIKSFTFGQLIEKVDETFKINERGLNNRRI